MRLTVVGSGTAAPEAERVCSSYFLRAGGTSLLLDCGPGAVHHLARFGLPWSELDHLLISHFHNDHIGDVPMLLFALKWGIDPAVARTRRLTVWGPAGLRARLRKLAEALGDHVADPGFPLEVREVAPGETIHPGDVTVRTLATPHTDRSLAYRVEGAGGSLGYTGDTGPSAEVAEFMAGVDLLVAECSLPDDARMATHLSPSSLAAMARAAGPAALLVTHVYPQLSSSDVAALLRDAGWAGKTLRATDGLELDAGSAPSPRTGSEQLR